MSAADDAYAKAEALIAEAKRDGTSRLSFDEKDMRALDRIPPEIAELGASLTELSIDNTQIDSLEHIAGLNGLQVLYFNNTQVGSLEHIAGLNGLQSLYFNNTQVDSLEHIAGLNGLQSLYFNNTQVDSLEHIAGLNGLQRLYFNNTQVDSLEHIARLNGLQWLSFNNTQVDSLEHIAGLNGLQRLSFNNTQVDSLEHIAGLNGLQSLYLNNTQVDSLEHIAGLVGLQVLYFNNTQVDSLEHIAGLNGLQWLSFNNTGISDMRPVKDFKSLRDPVFGSLYFKNCAATKLDPDGLGRLSEIEDDTERTNQTLDYLKLLTEWPPAGAATPADRPAAPVFSVPDTGPIIGSGDTMADADAEQAALHDECHRKVRNLLTAIGDTNQFATLRESAEYYRHTIDRPAPEIAATTLWSAGNALRSVLEAHEANRAEWRINDELTPAIATSLDDLVNTHGIYYLGHPKAAAVERKRREYQQGPKQPELEEVSRQIADKALGDASPIDYHTQILDTPRSVGPPLPLDTDTRDAILMDATTGSAIGAAASMAVGAVRDTMFNLLAAIGRKATIAKARGRTAFADPAVVNWVGTNWHLIERFFVLSTGQNARWLYWIKDLFL